MAVAIAHDGLSAVHTPFKQEYLTRAMITDVRPLSRPATANIRQYELCYALETGLTKRVANTDFVDSSAPSSHVKKNVAIICASFSKIAHAGRLRRRRWHSSGFCEVREWLRWTEAVAGGRQARLPATPPRA